jgi:hypothetical protein
LGCMEMIGAVPGGITALAAPPKKWIIGIRTR